MRRNVKCVAIAKGISVHWDIENVHYNSGCCCSSKNTSTEMNTKVSLSLRDFFHIHLFLSLAPAIFLFASWSDYALISLHLFVLQSLCARNGLRVSIFAELLECEVNNIREMYKGSRTPCHYTNINALFWVDMTETFLRVLWKVVSSSSSLLLWFFSGTTERTQRLAHTFYTHILLWKSVIAL